MASIRALRIISGGQTGVDQIALKTAKELGIDTGGWMPKGWLTADGPRRDFEERYGMRECPVEGYPARTSMNVRDSHVTIYFEYRTTARRSRGRIATESACDKLDRIFQSPPRTHEALLRTLRKEAKLLAGDEGPMVLNVAGTRRTDVPQVEEARVFLTKFINWYVLWI